DATSRIHSATTIFLLLPFRQVLACPFSSHCVVVSEQFRDGHLRSSRPVLPSSVANPVAMYTNCSWSHPVSHRSVLPYIHRPTTFESGHVRTPFCTRRFHVQGQDGSSSFPRGGPHLRPATSGSPRRNKT